MPAPRFSGAAPRVHAHLLNSHELASAPDFAPAPPQQKKRAPRQSLYNKLDRAIARKRVQAYNSLSDEHKRKLHKAGKVAKAAGGFAHFLAGAVPYIRV